VTAPEKPSRRVVLGAAGALLLVGAFSLVMSLLAENGRWPVLPPGALRGVDLVAGFAAAAALVVYLARRRGPAP
jgi:hypothetical protein